jgi:hypothetical protein
MMRIAYALLLMSWFFGLLWVLCRYEPMRSGLEDATEYQKKLMGILALIFFGASAVGVCADVIAQLGSSAVEFRP